MKNLDQLSTIQQVDQHKMLDLIHDFSGQVKHAEEIGRALSLDISLAKGVTKIVFTGLGGSAIGADLIRSYLTYDLQVPILVNRHYRLPAYVDAQTLLIVSSYSGNTEETLASLEEGIQRKARVVTIASGGEISAIAKKNQFPWIEIPSGISPRAALAYSVVPLLIALSKLGFASAYRPVELEETKTLLRTLADKQFGVSVPFQNNVAKQMAAACHEKYPIIYAGTDAFDVVALRWRGQIEENAKALASHHVLPEMNHNELVGWKYPKKLLKEAVVFVLRDKADHPRVQKRMELIKGIIEPLSCRYVEHHAQGETLLARMFSLIHLGDWISFYLAILNKIDPTPVEVINYLKAELAKEPVS